MSSPPPKNGSAHSSVRALLRQRRRYALWALILIGLGLGLLGLNLGFAGPLAHAAAFWPALVIAAGLVIFLASRASHTFAPPPFAIDREQYQAACLQVSTAVADVRVAAFVGSTQLAVGQFADDAGPRLQVEEARARLILDHRLAPPFVSGEWTANLVKNLPWSFDLQATIGYFYLNLRDLNVSALSLRSLAGHVDLTLPAAGQGEMDLRLTFGDLALRVPEGMAVKIRVIPGPLATIRLDDKRFIRIADNAWVTPYFSSSPHRFSLTVTLTTGDLVLA
ncbi:MAG TPA: hypothetical protein VI793_14275 [Anaerolineales bacterium]|nr:hypothetical protein [Anaerolineales bacterium]